MAKNMGHMTKDGDWVIELESEEENRLLFNSVVDGASSRIQPILITTLTTLLGTVPMAVSHGEGAEIYAPMGQAIVGGLITSTLITLVVIPVLYYMTEQKRDKKEKRSKNEDKKNDEKCEDHEAPEDHEKHEKHEKMINIMN
ncbi:efflux RND transporter permease subunit [uncultured Methanobrevibacter sp.]|uniref:efflux RND transporter permease subunit n=1 Tax=uncultured Methanobrevibacter sp. TaxID=253161 RepID=UPI003208E166